MFKPKAAELPSIPKLADIPKYQQAASKVENKRQELQACQDRLSQLRAELAQFDVGEMNPEKQFLQRSIAPEKEKEVRLKKELAGLDVLRQRVVSEISAQFSRGSDAAVRALLGQLAEAQATVAALEKSYEDFITKLEATGLTASHLARPFHLVSLGRLTDRTSPISQILAARGAWEAAQSVQEVAHA